MLPIDQVTQREHFTNFMQRHLFEHASIELNWKNQLKEACIHDASLKPMTIFS